MQTTKRLQEQRTTSNRIFMFLLLALIVLITGFIFVKSSYFTVGSVVVEGNKYLSADEIYRAAGIPREINIFRLDTKEIKHNLTCDLRVAEVEVTRRLPATIVISLQERQPLVYAASGYGFVQLDKQGVVLAAFKNIKQANVPIITGINLGNVYVGDKIEPSLVQDMLVYLSLLDETTLARLSEINVKSSSQAVVYTVNSIQIRLGNNERLPEKAKLTCDILREISEKQMTVEYVDLTYASPFVKFKK